VWVVNRMKLGDNSVFYLVTCFHFFVAQIGAASQHFNWACLSTITR
jgi:hypothetical protein